MVKIFMANVNSILHGLTTEQEKELSSLISYKTGGFGVPVEDKSLYNNQTKSTFTGLVPQVIKYLKSKNISFEVIDKRQKPDSNANFSIVDGFKMRDYQEAIVSRSSSREMLQAATGAGKTFIMANLIVKYNVKPIVVIAPKVSLAEQVQEEFEKFLGTKIGLVAGGINDVQDITICTPLSAPRHLLENAKMIMWDECHCIPSHSVFSCAKAAKNAYYRFGVSATPWRDGGDDILIEAALSIRKPHLSINASTLIKNKHLTPCSIVFIPIKEEFEWRGSYGDLYQRAIVNNEKRNKMIVNLTVKLNKKGRTTLILIKNIGHGDYLVDKIRNQMGHEMISVEIEGQTVNISTVEFLSGRDDALRRKAVLKATKEKKVKVLIGSTIADEGLDCPSLDALILAGSGKTSTRAFQRIGRVIRLYDGKKDAIVFDFMDETKTFKRHALIREALYKTESEWKIAHLPSKLTNRAS